MKVTVIIKASLDCELNSAESYREAICQQLCADKEVNIGQLQETPP